MPLFFLFAIKIIKALSSKTYGYIVPLVYIVTCTGMSLQCILLYVSRRLSALQLPLLLLSFFFSLPHTYAQLNQDVDPALQTDVALRAPVEVDGKQLFTVRGISSYPASVRAKTIQNRIVKAASNYSLPVDSVKSMSLEDRTVVYAGKDLIMNVYIEDGTEEGINKEVLAELVVRKIKETIIQYRSDRSAAVLKANTVKALGAIGILAVTLLVLIWIFRRLNNFLLQKMKAQIERVENVSFKLIQSNHILKVLQYIYTLFRFLFLAFVTFIFINYILALFPGTKRIGSYLHYIILSPIRTLGKGFLDYLPSLVVLILIFLATRYILKLVRLFFEGLGTGGITVKSFDPEWASPTFKIVKFLIIVFAFVVSFPYIPGSGSSAFQGVSVFLGVLFSLGSSSFIANIIAGYSMTYRKAFKRGDRIQVNENTGYVLDQTLMVTRLRSVKNEEIVIPNSVMLNSTITNYSMAAKERGIILHTTVGIGYGTSWRQVEAMLLLAAKRTTGLLMDPPPYVLARELGDFAVVYEINVYSNEPEKMLLYYTQLHKNILDVFNENKVQIMTPAYEGDPENPKVVPRDQWNTPLANEGA